MQKVLRSLLIELLPFELRVKIELLSKRRDIQNAEKQQELFKLLREYNIDNIAPLGSGTNRYAFKVNGFVIKVATDHDGKIDNFKEFKMTKRLFPDVTKTYEVSENGTLLVCEYVQPFQSYGEMLMYADKIRAKLAKISAVYLIGDVGIMSKNYANWGLRIGSDEPVCLDFAYIYDVKSEVFICSECKSGAILIPNSDYTKLVCPNKACGHIYEFEEIRTRIGNDVHDHEIGDLTKEGYLLHESNVLTELDPNRSNYLMKKHQKEKEVKHEESEEEIPYDNFVYEEKEDINMSNNFAKILATGMHVYNAKVIKSEPDDSGVAFTGTITNDTPVIHASVIPDPTPKTVPIPKTTPKIVHAQQSEPITIPDDGLVFRAIYNTKTEEPAAETSTIVEAPIDNGIIPEVKTDESEVEEIETIEPVITATVVEAKPIEETPKKESKTPVINEVPITKSVNAPKAEEVKPKHQKAYDDTSIEDFGGDNFLSTLQMVISRFARKVQQAAYAAEVYDEVRSEYVIETKNSHLHPDQFYNAVQNAVFHSLVNFLGMESVDNPETGKHEWVIHEVKPETLPTIIFLGRWNKYRFINSAETPEDGIKKYRNKFNDYHGLQDGWLPTFVSNLTKKIRIEEEGAQIVADRLKEMWCVDYPVEIEQVDTPVEMNEEHEGIILEHMEGQLITDAFNESDEIKLQATNDDTAANDTATLTVNEPAEEKKEIISDTFENEDDMIAFTSSLISNDTTFAPQQVEPSKVETPVEEDENDYDDEDEDDESDLNVYIYPDDPFDIINLCTSDLFGVKVSIPFYTKLTNITKAGMSVPSLADERNGMWDWLIHLTPDLMFYTSDPDHWLELNSESAQDTAKVVILDPDATDENGNQHQAIMGLYALHGVFTVDDDGIIHPEDNKEILEKLNILFTNELTVSTMSHLRKSLATTDLIRDEAYAAAMLETILNGVDLEDVDEDDETEEEIEEVNIHNNVITAPISDSSDIGIIKPIRRKSK